jgi:hypothetical protein
MFNRRFSKVHDFMKMNPPADLADPLKTPVITANTGDFSSAVKDIITPKL